MTPYARRARRPRRTCVVAQRPRWRSMAEAWRCCAATEAVAVPCNGHGRSSACVAEEEDWITAYVRGTIEEGEDHVLGTQGRPC